MHFSRKIRKTILNTIASPSIRLFLLALIILILKIKTENKSAANTIQTVTIPANAESLGTSTPTTYIINSEGVNN